MKKSKIDNDKTLKRLEKLHTELKKYKNKYNESQNDVQLFKEDKQNLMDKIESLEEEITTQNDLVKLFNSLKFYFTKLLVKLKSFLLASVIK